MEFKYHILVGALVAYIISIIFNLDFLTGFIIFSASILIDFDHYLWYSLETKNWNPLSAVRWYIHHGSRWKEISKKERDKYKSGVYIFHNWIFWTVLIILGYFVSYYFYLILIGFAIHIIPDLVVLAYEKGPIMQKISMGYIIKKNKGKKSIEEYNKYFKNR